ncbi:zinc metallo protein-like proteinase [Microthyrium microscopicum]|uniref:Zinc metallo protein-like proteinase n=1 Tax=Microthyrium microscopicum TaxID=703497 RepID=A0A6A6UJD6_9PEZI|nr:zinc metallo protein-like proteinase [Microthyrium microscopicum]
MADNSNQPDMDPQNNMEPEQDQIELTIHHHNKPITIALSATGTLSDLSDHVAAELSIPSTNQKFLISPKVGLLRPPFNNPPTLASLTSKKIVLMGSTTSELTTLTKSITQASASMNRKPGPIKAATPARTRDPKRAHADATYTFHSIRPLSYLPQPDRSHDFLTRLANDPGIRAAMRKHEFSVGLLTEMDPAMHTTRDGKTLGLNRNKGEVIELRLRTDAYDGYRDYKVIRQTLCHELAHNVWSDHDRNFHNLWNEIEKEVQREDWTRGGHSVSGEEFYEPPNMDEEHFDGGGWTGGEFVLGGAGPSGAGLSRREIIAKAVEERMKKQRDVSGTPPPDNNAGPSSS